MDAPVYHLDRVVHSHSEKENFDGPLDLILSLLSKNKMKIQDIQISLILNQYLAWMNRRQELDLEVASEFVIMAAHLVYIKTRTLLSIQDEEATNEMEALIASLEARQCSEKYAKIQQVLEPLRQRYGVGKDYITKGPEPLPTEQIYQYAHRPEDLPKALRKMLLRSGEKLPPSASHFEGIVAREPYPVEGKAKEILKELHLSGTLSFSSIFQASKSRSEVVATFLAVLELCRSNRVYLTGQGEHCALTWTEQPDVKKQRESVGSTEQTGDS